MILGFVDMSMTPKTNTIYVWRDKDLATTIRDGGPPRDGRPQYGKFIGYGTTNIGYGTTNTDAGVGIGLLKGDSEIWQKMSFISR